MTPLRHLRNGPDIDVALCGERDAAIFVRSSRLITCPVCRAKRDALVASRTSRAGQQLAAKARKRRETNLTARQIPAQGSR